MSPGPPRRMPPWPVLAVPLAVALTVTGVVLSGLVTQYRQLSAGTPAHATVTGCAPLAGSHDIRCTGTWSVGAAPAAGTVHGATASDLGHPVAVHVVDGAAYTDARLGWTLGLMVFFGVVPVPTLALVVRRYRRDRRDYQARPPA